MASDGSVEIRISASQDASVKATVSATKADIASLGSATQVSSAQIRAALGGSVASGEALMSALKGASAAAVEVTPAMRGVEVATGGVRVATSGAIQEYIRLGHEALTGNFSRMPGSAVVLASRMGGLTAATLGTTAAYVGLGAAVLGPAAAMAILAYREYEAQRAAQALAEGFALSGRGAIYTAAGVRGQIDALAQLPGVTRDSAQALIQFDSTHADLNGKLAFAANQLMPAYIETFGKKAPEALNTLKGKLAEISTADIPKSIEEFEKLNRTTLNLPAASVPAIEQMIRSGNGLGASLQIVAAVAAEVHVPIQTLGERIKSTSDDLAQQTLDLNVLKAAMRSAGADGAMAFATQVADADTKVRDLTGALRVLKAVQAAMAPPAKPDINEEDRFLAQLKAQASMAGESARQRHIDTALIEEANYHLKVQGLAEKEVVSSADQARKILGDQAAITERIAAAGFKEPKGAKGPNVPKQNEHIGDEESDAERESGQKRIENAEATNAFLLQIGQRSVDAFVAQAQDLENKRYAIELKANQDRQKADAGDRVALAKDVAQQDVISQAHVGRMNEIDRTAYTTRQQMRNEDFQAFLRDEDGKEQRYIRTVDAQLAAGKISTDQRAALEQQFTATIEREILKRWDDDHATLVAGNKDYEQAMREREAIVLGFSGKFETIDDNLIKDQAEKWKTFASDVRSSFNSALSQLIVEGGTFRSFMVSAVQGVANAFLSMGEKIAEDWIQNQITMMLSDDVSLDKFLANETAKAAAVLDGQAAQVGAVAAGSGAKTAIEAEGDSQSILNSAYTAAAKAYTSVMQSVPPPFNLVAAPVIAGATFAAVAAYDVISAAGGLDRVAYDGQLISAHLDEAVLPARIARPMMHAVDSGAFEALPSVMTALNTQNMPAMRPVSMPVSSHAQFSDVAQAMAGGRHSGGGRGDAFGGGDTHVTLNYQPHISGSGNRHEMEQAIRNHLPAFRSVIRGEVKNGNLKRWGFENGRSR